MHACTDDQASKWLDHSRGAHLSLVGRLIFQEQQKIALVLQPGLRVTAVHDCWLEAESSGPAEFVVVAARIVGN